MALTKQHSSTVPEENTVNVIVNEQIIQKPKTLKFSDVHIKYRFYPATIIIKLQVQTIKRVYVCIKHYMDIRAHNIGLSQAMHC